MKDNPRILLAAPTSKHKDYCFDDWAKHIKTLTYPVDYLIVDNTPDNGVYAYSKLVRHFPTMHIEPRHNENNYQLITRAQNIIRNFTLGNKYDYLFMLESDHFPPENVIEYFLSKRKLVTSLPYFIGQSIMSKIVQMSIEDFGNFRQIKLKTLDESFMTWNGNLKPKYQTGIGCILIKSSVLAKVKFRIADDNYAKAHADVYFHEDLKNLGIQNFVSELYFSTHKNTNWRKILNYD